MQENKVFKVQIPQELVRGSVVKDKEFVLLARLIQAYYSNGNKDLTFTIKYKAVMHHTYIDNNRKFKECMENLQDNGFLTMHSKTLPRNGALTITLNEKVIPELNENMRFVQLESYVLNRHFIEKVKHTGVKTLYHIMSYINYEKKGKDHCYASIERMSSDMGMSDKTLRKHLDILEKGKFIKVVRHKPETEYYLDKNGNEGLLYDRWNNHYSIKHEAIKKYVEKMRKNVS
ncbi:MAG: helix-turn-helix domain-containing protein [Bacillaceae bacterium]